MLIVSLNVNGVRSAMDKGLGRWIEDFAPDVVCFQEVKADRSLLPQIEAAFAGYRAYFSFAQKKGYSGVGTLTRQQPAEVFLQCGDDEFDREGRLIRLEFESFRLVNVYFPSGSMGAERQAVKERFMDFFYDYCAALPGRPTVIAGDFNICHQEIDIHHPERHHKDSGFLPHERAWFSKFLDMGWVDVFRQSHPEATAYTWWSFRSGARAKNLGWRIDYLLASRDLPFREARIHPEVVVSDHCPVSVRI
ncbi:MAG: exodeoxyribonuclease III [Bacteroidia bacterium]|nr:exodeoxyribonuclease III [Bacteroidia bacterium]